MKVRMVKAIALFLALSLTGCSGIWTNASVNHCNYGPPIFDTTMAAGLGGWAVALREANMDIYMSERNKKDFAISTAIVAAIFTISAYMGYADAYHQCQRPPDGR